MRISLITILLLISGSLLAQAKIDFDHKVHKFPDTKEGVLLEHDYTFTNSGDQPLLINDIKVSCSCTKFTYPKKPVPPGGKGTIHVTFDTHNKYEWQNRILEIQSNAKNSPEKIRFKVMVINPK